LTVTVAVACLLVSATLVAITVTVMFALTLGAVNRPLLETVPALADQVTPWLFALLTVAANCCAPPEEILALLGETETLTGEVLTGGVTNTLAVACLLESARLVAVTATEVLDVTVGAVNTPSLEIVPAPADQLTPVLFVFVTVAVNCCVAFDAIVALPGLTEMLTAGGLGGVTNTLAVACLLESARLVAVTATEVLDVTVGAVNTPLLEIAPALADQLTPVLFVFVTVAVNCCVAFDAIVALPGLTEMLTAGGLGGVTNTFAVACLLESARLVAVTATEVLDVTAGAVNTPLLEIAPALADQLTPVLFVCVTLAVNC